jgi:hypothetical protein
MRWFSSILLPGEGGINHHFQLPRHERLKMPNLDPAGVLTGQNPPVDLADVLVGVHRSLPIVAIFLST